MNLSHRHILPFKFPLPWEPTSSPTLRPPLGTHRNSVQPALPNPRSHRSLLLPNFSSLTYLSSFQRTRTLSWIVRDKLPLMATSGQRQFHSLPLPMKASTMVNSTGHFASPCRLRKPLPLNADFPPLSLFDKDHSAEALEGALRLAAPFSYASAGTHVLSNSPSLRLPDFASVLRPPRVDPHEDPVPPEPSVTEWLHNRAPRLIPSRFRQYSPVPRGLVDFFNSNIQLVQVATLIHSHLCNDEAATAEARRHKRDFPAHVFLRLTSPGTSALGSHLPYIPSVSPTPQNLPRTALASPPTLHASRPGPSPAQSSQAASARPQHPLPFSTSSDSKRPRLPGKGTSSGSNTGYMSQFSDSHRFPVGYAPPPSERAARGPYHSPLDKGKAQIKAQIKATSKAKTSLILIGLLLIKVFTKAFTRGISKGLHKGSDKENFGARGYPPVRAPPPNLSSPSGRP